MERLFPEEWNFGGEEHHTAGKHTVQIREELANRLDQPGKKLLDDFCDAYIRETNCEIRDAYTQGVCDGMELMMEYGRRQGLCEACQDSGSKLFSCSAAATASDRPCKTWLTGS